MESPAAKDCLSKAACKVFISISFVFFLGVVAVVLIAKKHLGGKNTGVEADFGRLADAVPYAIEINVFASMSLVCGIIAGAGARKYRWYPFALAVFFLLLWLAVR
jgi:hypothetical protein